MRKSLLYFVLLVLLSAFQCEDETYVPDNFVENNDLVQIRDNKANYAVDEFIVITTEIDNRQQTRDANTIAIDDFLVGNEKALFYSLGLFRVTSTNEKIPVIIENVQVEEGMIEYNDQNAYFNILSPYDNGRDQFISEIGVQLKEAVDYILVPDTARLEDDMYFILFDLSGPTAVGSLQLNTSILNADADGIYRFTVE